MPATVLSIMAAALERELLSRGVTVIDRAACEAIIAAVVERTAAAGERLADKHQTGETPEPGSR